MKKEGFDFFQNHACEYFPCHKVDTPENFNCLFCYCPLYALGDKCCGNPKFLDNKIKDCSNCTFPHKRENYDKIISMLR